MAGTNKEGHINQRLSDIAFAYKQEGFAGQFLFPEHPVDKGADEYTQFSKGNMFKNVNDVMGKFSEANLVQMSEATATYVAKNYALKGRVAQEDINNADDVLQPKSDKVEVVTSALLLQREIRMQAVAASLTTNKATPSPLWSAGSSTPVLDIEAAANAMFIRPNTLIISRPVWDILKFHAEVLSFFGGGWTSTKMATIEMMKQLFGVDEVIIAGARKNAAKDPNAVALSRVWGKNVHLAFVDPRKGRDIQTFGKMFAQKLDGGKTFQTREWERPEMGVGGSVEVQVEHTSTEKLISEDFGYFLDGCIA